MNKKLLKAGLLFPFLAFALPVKAQNDDFCDALTTILKDGPSQFRNIRGKLFSGGSTPSWKSGITVPGTIASLFIQANGLFYEGAVFESAKADSLGQYYSRYKEMLTSCLSPLGYKIVRQDNFYPGLAEYKKLAFMPAISENTTIANAPSHVTLEATYSKDIGKYTLVIYIFEH